MRKTVSLLVSLVLLAVVSTASYAAFTGISRSTYTAAIIFTAIGSVQASFEVRNVSDNAVVLTGISWDPATITLGGTTKWKASSQYIVMHSTITAASGGIQIYTDNKAADAGIYAYTGISTATAAGLVGYSTTTYVMAPSSTTLSMCWRVVDNSTTTLNIQRGTAGYPDRLWESTLGSGFPCFLWMMDRFTGGFSDGMDYITVKDGNRGIQYGEASWGGSASPDYIYIGADFTTAVTPRTYRTNTLRVEAFTE